MTDQPAITEPVPVQLTRIEGTINLIAYQMAEVKSDVADVKADLAGVKSRVTVVETAQASAAGAAGFLRAWLPTIVAAIGVAAALGFGIKFGG